MLLRILNISSISILLGIILRIFTDHILSTDVHCIRFYKLYIHQNVPQLVYQNFQKIVKMLLCPFMECCVTILLGSILCTSTDLNLSADVHFIRFKPFAKL